MINNKKYNIAIVGATGNVGKEVVNILEQRKFPVNNIYALASIKSLGKSISYGLDEEIKVENFDTFDFSKIDIIFACSSSEITSEIVKKIKNTNAVIIDKSSLYRLDERVPLIVPEVNLSKLDQYKNINIIASPNCNAIPISISLKPLEDNFGIKRIVISTYQATSGAGKDGMDELYEQTKAKFSFIDATPKIFPRPIAFNIIPQIGAFNHDGYTDEEVKITQEIQKILNITNLPVTVTAVRVPVFVGHCASVNVELEDSYSLKEIIDSYRNFPSIRLNDKPDDYICPSDNHVYDEVNISRLRVDNSHKNAINFWLTCDNLRKGAALNAVQIAEHLIKII